MDIMDEYELVKLPDGAWVATILKQAIGADRSNKEFAPLIGVSEATLSRYCNGKITKPMSKDLINKIFQNQANPTSGQFPVDIFELLEANGYALPEAKYKKDSSEEKKVSEKMALLLKTALFDRGINLTQIVFDDVFSRGKLKTEFNSEQEVEFDLEMNLKEEKFRGLFVFIPALCDDKGSKAAANDVINSLAPVFLTDAWKPEAYDKYKIYLCFADGNIYHHCIDKLESVPLNNRFAAIYIDTVNLRVVEETSFKSAKFENNINFLDMLPV